MLYNNHNRRFFFIPLLLLMMVFLALVPAEGAYNLSNPQVSNGISRWDCIWFGRYYQDSNSNEITYTPQPLKWRVLNISGNTALLITDHVIDVEEFNHKVLVSCSWETSTIRTYINSTMKPVMFTDAEATALESEVGLPSAGMMNNQQYGFADSDSSISSWPRSSKHTKYVENQLNFSKDAYWLSDTNGYKASVVYNQYVVNNYYNNNNTYGIRPVVRMNLSANVWYPAGTVSSDSQVDEIEYGKPAAGGAGEGYPSSGQANPSEGSGNSSSGQASSDTIPGVLAVGAFSYTVNKNSATIVAPENKNASKLTIPATVKINGKTYQVTSIAPNAFASMKNLTSVVIGKNVKSIGKNAFKGCSKLKKVTIKTIKLTKKSIGANAFKGIHKKAIVKCPKAKKAAYKKILLKKGMKKTMTFK